MSDPTDYVLFEAFKKANEERLKAIEIKGNYDIKVTVLEKDAIKLNHIPEFVCPGKVKDKQEGRIDPARQENKVEPARPAPLAIAKREAGRNVLYGQIGDRQFEVIKNQLASLAQSNQIEAAKAMIGRYRPQLTLRQSSTAYAQVIGFLVKSYRDEEARALALEIENSELAQEVFQGTEQVIALRNASQEQNFVDRKAIDDRKEEIAEITEQLLSLSDANELLLNQVEEILIDKMLPRQDKIDVIGWILKQIPNKQTSLQAAATTLSYLGDGADLAHIKSFIPQRFHARINDLNSR